MKYLKTKALKIFKLIIEWELTRTILKYMIKNLFLPHWVRQFALFNYAFLPIQSSLTYLSLRCFFSNQPNSIITFFKMNRVRFKFATTKGVLSGVKKHS